MEQLDLPIEKDRGLPHGRAWVVARGCGCPECEAARARLDAENRARATAVPPGSGPRRVSHNWRRPRWTKLRGAWVITEPPSVDFERGQLVNVANHTTGRVVQVKLGEFRGFKDVEPGLKLRCWRPVR